MKLILGRGNEAHTLTVVSEAVAVHAEAAVIEAHSVRVIAIVVRSRPVVAAGTDIEERSPEPTARSRQEDCTNLLHCEAVIVLLLKLALYVLVLLKL